MSAKMGAARRAAFLKALRETGNQTLAAERAKVSRSWVCLHRKGDPEFRRACDAAVASFVKLRMSGSNRPPSGWGFLDGEELVVRGSGGSGGGRRVQIARARLHQWTPRIEVRFFATLAAICNVRAACAAVGMSVASAYKHRARWPGFARRWVEAVEIGYRRLENGLTASAIALLDPPRPGEPAIEPIIAPMSVDDAIRLVRLHERQAREAAARRLGRLRGSGPRWPGVRSTGSG